MSDKEWLEKIRHAYKSYGASVEVEDFVKWLYKQYGIVYPS